MFEAVEGELRQGKYDLVVAAAAVSDFRPAERRSTKAPSDSEEMMVLQLERTQKIVRQVKKISPSTFLTIFAAEYLPSDEGELVRRATKKIHEAMADMVVVNDIGKEGIGFDSDHNEVTVIDSHGGKARLPRATKQVIAEKILTLAVGKIRTRTQD
jgi:phosphopantothenoylcysteine decarboxylase/phosphopantothenate--cysteine ligase